MLYKQIIPLKAYMVDKQKYVVAVMHTIAVFLILVGVGINSWISDDALISFRTVLNFSHGLGLVYNVGEHVQTYTNPLLVLMVSALYSLIGSVYVSYFVVVILSVLTYLILLIRGLNKKIWIIQTFFILAAISLSKCFLEYSTSGLEDSLSLACLSVAIVCISKHRIFGGESDAIKYIFWGVFSFSLAALTRLDTIIFSIPFAVFFLVYLGRNFCVKYFYLVCLGILPLLAWLAFAYIYYGDILPSTFYAKQSTGYPKEFYLNFGVRYFQDSFWRDPVTLLVIFFSIATCIVLGQTFGLLVSASCILYLLYVYYVGGTFFSGRFFYTTFGVSILGALISSKSDSLAKKKLFFFFVGIFMLLISAMYWKITPFFPSAIEQNIHGPDDVRRFHKEFGWELNFSRLPETKQWITVSENIKNNKIHCPIAVAVVRGAGEPGLKAGPCVTLTDIYGLLDPVLAKLPALGPMYGAPHQPGHFKRAIPVGYLDWKLSGNAATIKSTDIKTFASKITQFNQLNLFDLNRLKLIGSGISFGYTVENPYIWQDPETADAFNVVSRWHDKSEMEGRGKVGDLENRSPVPGSNFNYVMKSIECNMVWRNYGALKKIENDCNINH